MSGNDDVVSEIAQGCIGGLIEAIGDNMPWQVVVGLIIVVLVVWWLLAGHPGL